MAQLVFKKKIRTYEKGIECKGVILRARVSHFADSNVDYSIRIGLHIRFNMLKKKSCPGCDECFWIHDQIGEVSNDWPIADMDRVEDGKMYRIVIANVEKDWESGMVDAWDFGLVEFKEEEG